MLAPRSRAGPIGSTEGCWAAAMTVHPAIRVAASVTIRRINSFAMTNYSTLQIVGSAA